MADDLLAPKPGVIDELRNDHAVFVGGSFRLRWRDASG